MKFYGMSGAELFIIAISLGLGILFGFLSMKQAEKKGYSTVGFFCLGFFVGLIGLIIALCVPDRNKPVLTQPYVQQPQPQQLAYQQPQPQQPAYQQPQPQQPQPQQPAYQQPAYQQTPPTNQASNVSAAWVCPSCGN